MLKMKITKKEASYVQKIMQDRNNGDYCFARSHFLAVFARKQSLRDNLTK